jgi:hypothetical protein
MKSPTLKKIVVKCLNWQEIAEIDASIFDDVYMEAATRIIEKKKNEEDLQVAVVMECWEKKDVKKPDKHFMYNTYFILINAGLHEKAEILRFNFMSSHNIDLQKESLKGEENDGQSTEF